MSGTSALPPFFLRNLFFSLPEAWDHCRRKRWGFEKQTDLYKTTCVPVAYPTNIRHCVCLQHNCSEPRLQSSVTEPRWPDASTQVPWNVFLPSLYQSPFPCLSPVTEGGTSRAGYGSAASFVAHPLYLSRIAIALASFFV